METNNKMGALYMIKNIFTLSWNYWEREPSVKFTKLFINPPKKFLQSRY